MSNRSRTGSAAQATIPRRAEGQVEVFRRNTRPSGRPAALVQSPTLLRRPARIRAEAIAHARAVIDLCRLAGQPQMAGRFLEEDASLDEVRCRLLAAKAEATPRSRRPSPQPGRDPTARPWGDVDRPYLQTERIISMTTLTEGTHHGGFLVWEVLRDYTRETVTLAPARQACAGHRAGQDHHGWQIHGPRTRPRRTAARTPLASCGEWLMPLMRCPGVRSSAAPPSSTATSSSGPRVQPRRRSPPPLRRWPLLASSCAERAFPVRFKLKEAPSGHHGHL